MAANLGTLTAVLKADVSGLVKGFKRVQTESKNVAKGLGAPAKGLNRLTATTKGIGKLTSSLQTLGGAIGSALSIGVLVAGFDRAIDAASDFEETSSLIGEVFAQMTPQVVEFATTASKELGRSRKQMLEFAGGLQAMLVPLTGNREKAAEMSQGFATLAVDLGSFFNVLDVDALAALKSGIAGETEPLRKFGIVMTEAQLNAFALTQGIRKTTQQMSEAEKVTLRYNFILSRTTDAQGDAARTAQSFGNTQKRAAALTEGAILKLGAVIKPIRRIFLDLQISALNFFDSLSTGEQTAVILGGAIATIAVAVTAATIAFAPFAVVAATALGGAILPVLAVVAILGALALAIGKARLVWQENSVLITAAVSVLATRASGLFKGLFEFIDTGMTAVRDLFLDSWVFMAEGVAGAAKGIVKVIISLRGKMVDLFAQAFTAILGLIKKQVGGILLIMQALGAPKALTRGLSQVADLVGETTRVIKGMATAVKATDLAAGLAFSKGADGVADFIREIAATAKGAGTVGEVIGLAFTDLVELAASAGGDVGAAMGESISEALDSFLELIPKDLRDAVTGAIEGLGDISFKTKAGAPAVKGGLDKEAKKAAAALGKAQEQARFRLAELSGDEFRKAEAQFDKAIGEWLKLADDARLTAGEIDQGVVGLTKDFRSKIEKIQAKLDAEASALGDALIGKIVGSLGEVGSLIESAVQGAEIGGPLGALGFVVTDLLLQSEAFQSVVGLLNKGLGFFVKGLDSIVGAFVKATKAVEGARTDETVKADAVRRAQSARTEEEIERVGLDAARAARREGATKEEAERAREAAKVAARARAAARKSASAAANEAFRAAAVAAGAITEGVDGVEPALGALADAANAAASAMSFVPQGVKVALRRFQAIDPRGDVAGPSRRITLEELAVGGIVRGPTPALIGESGPEAVIPLDRLSEIIGGGGGGVVNNFDFANSIVASQDQLMLMIKEAMRQAGFETTGSPVPGGTRFSAGNI